MSHNHGDSSMGDSGTLSGMGVFHSKLGIDVLWFSGWQPTSKGATAGAAIGLFFLAAFTRLFVAIRAGIEISWRHEALLESLKAAPPAAPSSSSSENDLSETKDPKTLDNKTAQPDELAKEIELVETAYKRLVPRFILGRELLRGAMQIFQSFLGYLLMLAFMMCNAYWCIGILLGLGFGEVLFGRYIPSMADVHT